MDNRTDNQEKKKKTGTARKTTPRKTTAAQKTAPKKTAPKKPAAKKTAQQKSAERRERSLQDEKKRNMRARRKMPKSLEEQKKYRESRTFRGFFTQHSQILDFTAMLLLFVSAVFLYCLLKPNDRAASIWCNRVSETLFGTMGLVFFVGLLAFSIRCLLRNFQKLSRVPYGIYGYLLGLFAYLLLLIQYTSNKLNPFGDPAEAGGSAAEAVRDLLTRVVGNGGMIIILVGLAMLLFWRAWLFFAEREKEKGNIPDVPVYNFWDQVYTAADAEDNPEAMDLTDMTADFTNTEGLLSLQPAAPKAASGTSRFRPQLRQSLRKLGDALSEIAQPVGEPIDKERIIRAETSRSVAEKDLQSQQPSLFAGDPSMSEYVPEETRRDVEENIDKVIPAEPDEPPAEEIIQSISEAPAAGKTRRKKVVLDEESEKVSRVPEKEEPIPTFPSQHGKVMVTPDETIYSFTPTVKRDPAVVPNAPAPAESLYKLPDIAAMLDPVKPHRGTSPDDPDVLESAERIEAVLEKHGVPGKVVDIQCGPTFTQFGVEPGFLTRGGRRTRVRVSQIEAVKKDLAMELSVQKLSIVAPIQGKTYIGFQIQNPVRVPVTLREVIEVSEMDKWELGIAMGKDINGKPFTADLTRMPHLLIAGATGSGKSVCMNAILSCFLLKHSPDELKLILIDPKRVELTGYNGIPHLVTPVVTDPEQASNVLQWALTEMDTRNLHFLEKGVRNIQDYNQKFPQSPLPYIVIMIDELANLMMEAGSEVEGSIIRLAQQARAMGIHLIVATQRPSRDVITGTIKGNLPTRIAFTVMSHVDSMVILDRVGAENLFNKGDMLFISSEETNLRRLQCVYVSDEEILRIVNYWKKAGKPKSDVPQPVTTRALPEAGPEGTLTQLPIFSEDELPAKKTGDVLYDDAVKLVRRQGRASANMLVSRLSIGYSRANKLLARMEEEGIISPPNANPSIPREILDYGDYGPEADPDQD